jgi:hypothetical protein
MVSLRRNSKRFVAPLAILLAAIALLSAGSPSHWIDVGYRFLYDHQAALVTLEREYGISIEYDDASGILPELWRVPPASGEATAIDELELSRYARVLAAELQKYPADVISANLEHIYLIGKLRLFGADYGGTSLGKSIFLTSGSRARGYDAYYLESLFHHEFSSVLLRHHSFPELRWKALNPAGFTYTDDDADVLQAIARGELSGNAVLYEQGFIAEYGHTTLENDFNLYAETVFVDPDRMQALINEHRAIREKYYLLKEFYLNVSPNFQDVFGRIE